MASVKLDDIVVAHVAVAPAADCARPAKRARLGENLTPTPTILGRMGGDVRRERICGL